MRVLVTGGAGFIGSHLVRALLARGDSVTVLDNFSTGLRSRLEGLAGPLSIVEGDIRDAGAAARACQGSEAVLHLAAQVSVPRSVEDPQETTDVNVTGLRTVLEAARAAGARHFVLASSCAVYGASDRELQSEDDPPRPASPYAASKLAGEALVTASAASAPGMRALSLRFFNVYGRGQRPDSAYAAVVPAFAAALRNGRPLQIHGDGSQSRDLVHVDDVVRANLLALAAPPEAAGRSFNVGTGRATSIAALAECMSRAAGSSAVITHAPARAGDLSRSLADTRLSAEVLGFRAAIDLEEGLRRLG